MKVVCLFVIILHLGILSGTVKSALFDDYDANKEENDVLKTRPDVACTGHDFSMNTCQNFARFSSHRINQHVRKQLTIRYSYDAMANFFERDDEAYPGFAKLFRALSSTRKEQSDNLMEYMNERGGRLRYKPIQDPKQRWSTPLEALEEGLKHEKDIQDELLDLHWVAQEKNDPHLQNFLEDKYLSTQVENIKKLSDFITVVIRLEADPLGWTLFDNQLKEGSRGI